MNLNKCERCGTFFATKNSVCPNCVSKDENDIKQLKTFLNDADSSVSVESLSYSTGVSLKNVNRFLKDQKLNDDLTNLGLDISDTLEGNIHISL